MRVYYWVRDMARKLRGTEEEKFLIDTQRMYEKALRSTGERRGYGDAQFLAMNAPGLYDDKIRAFINADELLQASSDYVGEEAKHERKDKFVEFARGKVRFKVGKNGYLADVVVGIRRSGRAYLYDIVKLTPIEIADTPFVIPAIPQKSEKADSPGTSADNSIIDGAQEVNTGAIQERRLSSARRGSSGKAGAHDADTQSSNGDYSPEQMISQDDAASQAKSDMRLALERALGKKQGQSSIGLSYDELVRRARERYPQGAGAATDGILRSTAPQNDRGEGAAADGNGRVLACPGGVSLRSG